ncbi:uncharacterized protein LOC110363205 isoform X2 [Columba livia]|uniref:uncharacterized protein LOC110363205 isoform X2 n=1 Tax=Columba livia TaxID=8932 RepID=UPI0031BB31B1
MAAPAATGTAGPPPRPCARFREAAPAARAMEERDTRGGFGKDTVDRLLRRHFRDRRTRGTGAAGGPGWAGPGPAPSLPERFAVAVNGDALLLMAEMLKVFVRAAGFLEGW